MIYGKLPVVFLSVIASEKAGSTNSMIASYILDHMDEVKNLGIRDGGAVPCGPGVRVPVLQRCGPPGFCGIEGASSVNGDEF